MLYWLLRTNWRMRSPDRFWRLNENNIILLRNACYNTCVRYRKDYRYSFSHQISDTKLPKRHGDEGLLKVLDAIEWTKAGKAIQVKSSLCWCVLKTQVDYPVKSISCWSFTIYLHQTSRLNSYGLDCESSVCNEAQICDGWGDRRLLFRHHCKDCWWFDTNWENWQ